MAIWKGWKGWKEWKDGLRLRLMRVRLKIMGIFIYTVGYIHYMDDASYRGLEPNR